MSYSWDKFLRPLGATDTNIQIMDNTGVVTYTINPFTVINLFVKNNMVVISLKSQRIISIPLSSNNEAKLALPRIKQLIDTLQKNAPIFINNEIKNYITSVSAKFFYQTTIPTGTGTDKIIPGSFWYDSEYGNLYTYIYDGDYYQWVTAVGEIGPVGTTGIAGSSGTSGYDGDAFRVEYNSSIDLDTTIVSSNYTITIDPDLSYSAAQLILISNNLSNYIEAQVLSYDSSTGELVYKVLAKFGTSAYSTWVVNLDGAAGGDGTSGTSGSSGVNGTSGSSGVNGTSGSKGTSGSSGSSGTRGTSGSSGVNGTSGTMGTSGTSGTTGTSGSRGTSGLSGTSGSKGTSGSRGTSGSSGTRGTSGSSGIDGAFLGTHGSSGSSGTRGTSGTRGSSGSRGTSGTAGTSGTIGTSGSSGVDGGFLGTHGTSGSSGQSPASGTLVLLSANETPVSNSSTNATPFTYTLGSNVYSRILIESECGLFTNANTNATVTFNIIVGGVAKRSKIVRIDATGALKQYNVGRSLKYSEQITGGAVIQITTTSSTGGTWTVDSLRVYGVI